MWFSLFCCEILHPEEFLQSVSLWHRHDHRLNTMTSSWHLHDHRLPPHTSLCVTFLCTYTWGVHAVSPYKRYYLGVSSKTCHVFQSHACTNMRHFGAIVWWIQESKIGSVFLNHVVIYGIELGYNVATILCACGGDVRFIRLFVCTLNTLCVVSILLRLLKYRTDSLLL